MDRMQFHLHVERVRKYHELFMPEKHYWVIDNTLRSIDWQ